eukprot:g32538.t1
MYSAHKLLGAYISWEAAAGAIGGDPEIQIALHKSLQSPPLGCPATASQPSITSSRDWASQIFWNSSLISNWIVGTRYETQDIKSLISLVQTEKFNKLNGETGEDSTLTFRFAGSGSRNVARVKQCGEAGCCGPALRLVYEEPSASPTASPTASPSKSCSLTRSVSPTVSESATVSVSPTVSMSPTVSLTRSVSPTILLTRSVSPTVSESATLSVSPTVSMSPTVSLTRSVSSTISLTRSVSPTSSTSVSASASASASASKSSTSSVSVTASQTTTSSVSVSASIFRSATISVIVLASISQSATSSVSVSASQSATSSVSVTASQSATSSVSVTASQSATSSVSRSNARSRTRSKSVSASHSQSPSKSPAVVAAAPVLCGDGTCQPTENCSTCPLDCGWCPPPASTSDSSAPAATDGEAAIDCSTVSAVSQQTAVATSSDSQQTLQGANGLQVTLPAELASSLGITTLLTAQYGPEAQHCLGTSTQEPPPPPPRASDSASSDRKVTNTFAPPPPPPAPPKFLGPVVTISVYGPDGSEVEVKNLSEPIEFFLPLETLPPRDACLPSGVAQQSIPECSFYRADTGVWSSEGCITVGDPILFPPTQDYPNGRFKIMCKCTHLTEFAVLLRATSADPFSAPTCALSPSFLIFVGLYAAYGLACVAQFLRAYSFKPLARNSSNKKEKDGLNNLLKMHGALALLATLRCISAFRYGQSAVQLGGLAVALPLAVVPLLISFWAFSSLTAQWASMVKHPMDPKKGKQLVKNRGRVEVLFWLLMVSMIAGMVLTAFPQWRNFAVQVVLAASGAMLAVSLVLGGLFAYYCLALSMEIYKANRQLGRNASTDKAGGLASLTFRMQLVGVVVLVSFLLQAMLWVGSIFSLTFGFGHGQKTFAWLLMGYYGAELLALCCLLFLFSHAVSTYADRASTASAASRARTRTRTGQVNRSKVNRSAASGPSQLEQGPPTNRDGQMGARPAMQKSLQSGSRPVAESDRLITPGANRWKSTPQRNGRRNGDYPQLARIADIGITLENSEMSAHMSSVGMDGSEHKPASDKQEPADTVFDEAVEEEEPLQEAREIDIKVEAKHMENTAALPQDLAKWLKQVKDNPADSASQLPKDEGKDSEQTRPRAVSQGLKEFLKGYGLQIRGPRVFSLHPPLEILQREHSLSFQDGKQKEAEAGQFEGTEGDGADEESKEEPALSRSRSQSLKDFIKGYGLGPRLSAVSPSGGLGPRNSSASPVLPSISDEALVQEQPGESSSTENSPDHLPELPLLEQSQSHPIDMAWGMLLVADGKHAQVERRLLRSQTQTFEDTAARTNDHPKITHSAPNTPPGNARSIKVPRVKPAGRTPQSVGRGVRRLSNKNKKKLI